MIKEIYFTELTDGNFYWIGEILLALQNTAVSPPLWSFWRFDAEDDDLQAVLDQIENSVSAPTYGNIGFDEIEMGQILNDFGLSGAEAEILSGREKKKVLDAIHTVVSMGLQGGSVDEIDWRSLRMDPQDVAPAYFMPWSVSTLEMPTFGLFETLQVISNAKK